MQTRTEVDSLGEKKVPKDAYYGIQTLRAVKKLSSEQYKGSTSLCSRLCHGEKEPENNSD